MIRAPRLVGVLVLMALLAVAPAAAQLKAGDVVVSSSMLLALDRGSGAWTTVAFGPQYGQLFDSVIGPGNRSIIALQSAVFQPTVVVQINAAGTATTLAKISDSWLQISTRGRVHQDGRYRVPLGDHLHQLVSGRLVPALYTRGSVADCCVDVDSGDYLVGIHRGPAIALERMSRDGRSLGTLTVLTPGARFDLDQDQRSGNLWVTESSAVRLIDRASGAVLRHLPTRADALEVDQTTGHVLVAYHRLVDEYDSVGVRVGQWTTPVAMWSLQALDIWGSRNITGAGPATPGSTYALRVSFPRSPGARYVTALSLSGTHPGIPIPGGMVHIRPDPLFFATLRPLPGLSSGFTGQLDPNGEASASFHIPAFVPPGTVYTVAAVAVNGAGPGGLVAGESHTVVVN